MLSAVAPLAQPLSDHILRAGLIDLDGTVFFQFAFFAVLVFLLPSIIFKPLLARFEQREARTVGARDEAKSLRHAADDQVAKYDAAMAEQKRKALAERAETRAATVRMAAEMVAAARETTNGRIDRGLAAQREQADAARKSLEAEANQIARQISDKLVEG
jgi:F-type H+-transporting ATPase subunit b